MLIFCGGRKTGEPGENPSEKSENQQQTQPTYDAGSGNRTRATLVEGEPIFAFMLRKIQSGEGGGVLPEEL